MKDRRNDTKVRKEGIDPLTSVRLSKILQVWESFSGWYWFLTLIDDEYAFGLVKAVGIEWSHVRLQELYNLAERGLAWPVQREDWKFCPRVIDDVSNSQEGYWAQNAAQCLNCVSTAGVKTVRPSKCSPVSRSRRRRN